MPGCSTGTGCRRWTRCCDVALHHRRRARDCAGPGPGPHHRVTAQRPGCLAAHAIRGPQRQGTAGRTDLRVWRGGGRDRPVRDARPASHRRLHGRAGPGRARAHRHLSGAAAAGPARSAGTSGAGVAAQTRHCAGYAGFVDHSDSARARVGLCSIDPGPAVAGRWRRPGLCARRRGRPHQRRKPEGIVAGRPAERGLGRLHPRRGSRIYQGSVHSCSRHLERLGLQCGRSRGGN